MTDTTTTIHTNQRVKAAHVHCQIQRLGFKLLAFTVNDLAQPMYTCIRLEFYTFAEIDSI